MQRQGGLEAEGEVQTELSSHLRLSHFGVHLFCGGGECFAPASLVEGTFVCY